MLKCSTSLWSADLTNLCADMARVAPFSERFHIDVADGHYVPTMLFFPDLVKQLPANASLHLISHSRGGLVGDVLSRFCVDNENNAGFSEDEINFLKKDTREADIKNIKTISDDWYYIS